MMLLAYPPGMGSSYVVGIDARGRVYGLAGPVGGTAEPFVWDNGVPVSLPRLGYSPGVWGVNDCGVGVGATYTGLRVTSLLWLTDC